MIPFKDLPPWATWLTLLVVGSLLLMMIGIALGSMRALRQGGQASVALAANHVFVAGQVTFAKGESTALTIALDENATAVTGAHGASMRWREIRRRSTQRPFYVQLTDGHRTRVEPTEATIFAALLELWVTDGMNDRTRGAALVEGQQVWVSGALVAGYDPEFSTAHGNNNYRDREPAGNQRVLCAASSIPLTVATLPLDTEFMARARVHRNFAITWAIAAFVFFTFGILPPVSRAFGTQMPCVVDSSNLRVGKNGSGHGFETVCHTAITEVHSVLYEAAPRGSVVPAQVGFLSSQIGGAVTINFFWLGLSILVGAILARAYQVRLRASVPWYRQTKVDSVETSAKRT